MEAVLNTGFSLSYREEVLHFLFPLFPPLTPQATHIHSLTRLLVSLSDASLTIPLLSSLVHKEKLVAYQLAFDLAEGGTQEFLGSVREGLPLGEGVRPCPVPSDNRFQIYSLRRRKYSPIFGVSYREKHLSSFT
jgi:26S proteasome regulatory subunit N2